MAKLIGREREMAELRRCVESDRSEFVIVYGRRRVGKTFLVDQFFQYQYDFTFVGGHRLSKEKQLRNFSKALKKYAHLTLQPKLKDWDEAFDALEEYMETLPDDKRKIIFIDEMPWIDTPKSEFVDALENFWISWASRRNDIVFIASGSATSWMMDKLVENQGGLHARTTSGIYVRPFTLKETEQYIQSRGMNMDRYQILQTYMTMGGVPYYLSLLDTHQSLVQNLDRLFYAKNAVLRAEFDELYNALFTHAEKYTRVVQLLYKSREGLTREQLISVTGMDGKTMKSVLKTLERCDFITSFSQFRNSTRGTIYRLVDFYTLFYYRFVDGNNSHDEQWWSHNYDSPGIESWQGTSFELICLTHIAEIKQALGISGITANASSWRYSPSEAEKEQGMKGAQIDLVLDRGDRTINLCEMKFSTSPYRITDNYEQRLRERMETFRTRTRTTKTLQHTFVTTFGVANGIHSSIVNSELTMNDLFR